MIFFVDVASVGSSTSDKGPGSGRNSPVVKDKKLFKSTGVKKEVGSLGKSSNIISQVSNVHKEWDFMIIKNYKYSQFQRISKTVLRKSPHPTPREIPSFIHYFQLNFSVFQNPPQPPAPRKKNPSMGGGGGGNILGIFWFCTIKIKLKGLHHSILSYFYHRQNYL